MATLEQTRKSFEAYLGQDNPMTKMIITLQERRAARKRPAPVSAPLAQRKDKALSDSSPAQIVALDGMDQVDWHALHHAYGPADDVPIHLRLLLSPDKEVEWSGWQFLYEAVLHQGSVYPATVAIIPILLQMLAHGEPPSRDNVMSYFLSILDVEYPGDEESEDLTEPILRIDPDDIAAERALRTGIPLYLALLKQTIADNPDADYLPGLIRLLRYFPPEAAQIITTLGQIQAQVTKPELQRDIERTLKILG
jgi:hypothetical protein